jgi:hypothetical protein
MALDDYGTNVAVAVHEMDAVPAAGTWSIAIGHRSPGRACRAAEQ